MDARAWRKRGELVTVCGNCLFVVDTGGHAPALVILHGYPTSSYDYWKTLPLLAEHFRVIVHDHLGFGYSDKPETYSYSLVEQADHAVGLWQNLGLERVHLLAHDYGTSIATELLARRLLGVEPVVLRSLTLCNGSMHIELARLRLIQRLLRNPVLGPVVARASTRRVLARNLRRLFVDPARLSESEIDAIWELLLYNHGRSILHRVTRYLDERQLFWHRWIGALRKSDVRTLILWAREDPVAVEQMAQVLAAEIPRSDLVLLDELGHFPMLENPQVWSQVIIEWLIGQETRRNVRDRSSD